LKIASGGKPWIVAIGLVAVVLLSFILFWNRGVGRAKRIAPPAGKDKSSAAVVRDMNFSPKPLLTQGPVAMRGTVHAVPSVQAIPKVIKPVALPVTAVPVAIPSVQPSPVKKSSYKIY
jgi:hypothetical protein